MFKSAFPVSSVGEKGTQCQCNKIATVSVTRLQSGQRVRRNEQSHKMVVQLTQSQVSVVFRNGFICWYIVWNDLLETDTLILPPLLKPHLFNNYFAKRFFTAVPIPLSGEGVCVCGNA